MFWVNPNLYDRPKLDAKSREFLLQVVPLAGFLQQQTLNKAIVTDKLSPRGIFTSVLAAHILFKSEFGKHPLSQVSCGGFSANNLALLKTHQYWKKISIPYKGEVYRGYKNWHEFAIDYSDMLSFHEGFEDVLALNNPMDQIKAMSRREESSVYIGTIVEIIKSLGLVEFDKYVW